MKRKIKLYLCSVWNTFTGKNHDPEFYSEYPVSPFFAFWFMVIVCVIAIVIELILKI